MGWMGFFKRGWHIGTYSHSSCPESPWRRTTCMPCRASPPLTSAVSHVLIILKNMSGWGGQPCLTVCSALLPVSHRLSFKTVTLNLVARTVRSNRPVVVSLGSDSIGNWAGIPLVLLVILMQFAFVPPVTISGVYIKQCEETSDTAWNNMFWRQNQVQKYIS